MNHRVATVICSLTLLIGLAACAQQPSTAAYDQPGFLYGLFHGFTIFFGLIASIFIDIRIYAFPNTGFWYC